VVGVTLSEEQLKASRRLAEEAGVADHVRFELIDYRKIQGEFDRIVSVGMFEHVGARHYGTYFAKCRSLLKPDGVMLVHSIGVFGQPPSGPDPFTDKWIFPGYNLPSLSQMTSASEKARLIVSDVETLRLHYVPTLLEWLQRTHEAHDRIVEMYDERFFRMWEFYLAGGVVMFKHGAGCNYQVQLIRDRNALPITRDYIAEDEAKYRAAEAKPAPAARPRSAGRKKALKPSA
jgi:cyclopropane-fatty-acyl-phospholipid synthase